MTMLIDIRAFLTTARTGSFSAAARTLGIAPSVVTKRVGRLEDEIGARLFHRSTRTLTLTAEGERLRPRLQTLVGELDEALSDVQSQTGVAGHLRIKSPTTVGALYVGPAMVRFQVANPKVTSELVLIDRSVNPLEEGFDLALGALPQSYAGVTETPLCAYPRLLVASPAYLAAHPPLETPAEIVRHDCLAFVPAGLTWTFQGPQGAVSVDVHASFIVNDSRLLIDAATQGLGLAVVPEFLAREALAAGQVVPVMPGYPIDPYWLKAMVPRNKAHRPEVRALLAHLKAEFEPPPWDR